MAEAAAVEQVSDDDAFAEAFGQAVAAVDEQPAKETKNEPAVAADKTGADPETKTEAEGGDKADAKDTSASGGGAADAEGDTKGGGKSDADPDTKPTPAAITSEDLDGLREEIKALKPAPKEEPVKEPTKVEPPAEPEPYKFTEQEQQLLDEFGKEWKDVAPIFEVREKRLVHDLTQQLTHRFSAALDSVLQQIEQGLTPLIQGHVQSAQERHVNAVRAAHSDYDSLKEPLSKWIDEQPKYLKDPLRKVYQEGSTEDVISLYADFKKATGRAQPQSQGNPPTKQQTAPKKDVVPEEKVAAMAPVQSKRTVVETAGVDNSDYDSAFAEALAAQGR